MEFEIKPTSKFSLGISELIRYHELFFFFTWRDIKVKYKETVLGFLWAILQPLLMTLLFTLAFGKMAASHMNLKVPYALFALSGYVIWGIFSSGVQNAGNSMVSNANIIKKIYFPRLIIPISSILVSLFDFLMAFLIFLLFLVYFQVKVDFFHFVFHALIGLFTACIATFGVGTLLAALNVKYRDFRYVIPFFIQAMLFASPVIYSLPFDNQSWLGYIYTLNPMYAPIELFRHAIVTSDILVWNRIVPSLISGLFFLVMGVFVFRKTEAYFADIA